MKRILKLLLALLLLAPSAEAKLVWSCDFESSTDRNQWTLNPAATPKKQAELLNKWYIGALGNYSEKGGYGLYISSDEGKTSSYDVSKAMWTIAYCKISLPKGDYNLYFDWRAYGNKNGTDQIRACYIPIADSAQVLSGNSVIPKLFTTTRVDTTTLSLSMTWQYATTAIHSDGNPAILAFVWTNVSEKNSAPPAGSIDNIEIHTKSSCTQPTDISHTAVQGVVSLHWKGNGDYYTIDAYDYTTNTWHVYDNIREDSIQITDLTEGMQTFRIRSYCGNDMSAYAIYSKFIIYEGTRCIDYLSLKKSNCYIGHASEDLFYRLSIKGDLASFTNACVDYGYTDSLSRHTIHYLQNEYDPRTNNQLKTVPDGEIASVRLGNWSTGAEAEAVSFPLLVEAGNSDILKIKYAVVLQTPDNPMHDSLQQSHFFLRILDAQGRVIDGKCSSADFAVGYGDMKGWSLIEPDADAKFIDKIFWRDWDTISVSLRQYIGEKITIQLISSDCTQSGHFGYAYFTLACESGELKGLSCGEEPTQNFKAPDGFDYRWYLADNPNNVLSREQDFHIEPTDTNIYVVDVINKAKPACYYQLEASGLPRFPIAKSNTSVRAVNCLNMVTFTNESYVLLRNRYRTQHQDIISDQKIIDIAWDFGDGSPIMESSANNVSHGYPTTGGKYTAKMYAYLSNRTCVDSLEIPLDLKDISVIEYKVEKHVCEGESWKYMGNTYFNTTHDTVSYRSVAGCDSVCILDFYVHDLTPYKYTDTVCANDLPFKFFDGTSTQDVYQSGVYIGRYPHKFSEDCTCDSISELTLHVEPKLIVNMAETVFVCMDNQLLEIPYSIFDGAMDSICFEFGDDVMASKRTYCFAAGEPITIDFSNEDIEPGRYPISVSYRTPLCPAENKKIYVEIGYSSSILDQKSMEGWVGILKNDYHFVSYQWYRDGVLIPGATESYLPVTDRDKGHAFTVLVTREGESSGITTCPIVYEKGTSLEQLRNNQENCKVYTLTGALLYEGKLSDFTAGEHNHIYLITYTSSNETVKLFIP